MSNKSNFKLIDGTFLPEEAKVILTTLINNKIDYHNLQIFSDGERFGEEITAKTTQRIAELKQDLASLLTQVETAKANNKKFSIKSSIDIDFV